MIKFNAMTHRFLVLAMIGFSICSAAEVAPLRFQHAHDLAAKGQEEEALQEYRAILLDDPDNADAYFEAGKIRAQQKKWNAAVQNFELSLQHKAGNWPVVEALANAHEQQGQREKAIADWRLLADKGPKDQKEKATGRIEKLLGAGDAKEASTKDSKDSKVAKEPKDVKEAKNNKPTPPIAAHGKWHYDSPAFLEGVKQYQANKWAKSLDCWRKVLVQEPGNPGAFYYAGVCRYNLGQIDKAEYNLVKSYDFPDKGFNAYFYMARIYEKQKHFDKARSSYEAYIAKTTSADGKKDAEKRLAALPKPSKVELAKGAKPSVKSTPDTVAKTDSAKPIPSAKPNPEKVQTIDNGVIFAFGSLDGAGAAEMQKVLKAAQSKDFNKAIDLLKEVRLNYPGSANALAAAYDMAALYHYLGLSENLRVLAAATLREEVPEPYLSAFRYMLANALKESSDLAASRSILDSVATDKPLGPTSSQKHVLESQLAELQKSVKDIPAFLEKAIASEKDPMKRADLRLRLAQTQARQGATANALKTYNELLQSCSAYTADQCRKALYSIGDIQYQNKDWDDAIAQYRKACDSYPNPDDSPWGLYQIGNALRQKKDNTAAIKAYDELQQKFPNSYWAEQGKWNRDDVIWRAQNAKALAGH